jgi:hypothetical protein
MPAVALVFNGPINYPATKIFRNVLCNFAGGQPMQQYGNVSFTEVYILMSSEGGSAEDAIALYNLISALPADVYTVNMGQIASAANVVFLAEKSDGPASTRTFIFIISAGPMAHRNQSEGSKC